ncbi:type IV secretory system conjugative DNA transfer family protein [Tenacibaculum larymnensis]|uniref:Type IV secretory system conjugative DNA transfer family protein n=1 Tax=Tenacibaculum larymnensis TaxID=2878201 RepID=A0A9X4INS4_9FLAO|nr:type IV secretory system conjugative DNA transfer family protein [Tenacibaculum larymnensis]MDE1206035.1 type IV secretory system conjugative DNA transfer family protein [Tenacibaculum larymnensis]
MKGIISIIIILIIVYRIIKSRNLKLLDIVKGKFENTDFYLKGRSKKYYINNLNKGAIAIGGAGSGKTYSFIIPLIAYMIKYRGCLILDPKGELTPLINKESKKWGKPVLNFSLDENYDKLNPLTLCNDKNDIIDFSNYFLSGIVGIPKDDNAKYFFNSAKSVLTGVIIFLRNRDERFSTIPHIVALFLTVSAEELIMLLSSDQEASRSATILKTVKKDPKLLGSILSTFTAFFSSLDTPKIFRNLVTDESIKLPNDLESPNVINLVFNLQKRDLYSPIYSSIVGLIIKKMNKPEQHESAVILDEFPVLSIPNYVDIPETSRSNKIANILAIQDLSQLITRYDENVASSIISNMGSQFLFRTTNPKTLAHFEKLLGVRLVKDISKNKSTDLSFKTSKTTSYKERNILRNEKIIKFKPGECFGLISEGNHSFVENDRVNGNHYLKKDKEPFKLKPGDDDRNMYETIYQDIKYLVRGIGAKVEAPQKFKL